MKAPVLIIALILGLAAALAACEDGEEELAPALMATPTATGSSTPASTAAPDTVAGTPAPVPSGWKEYSDPQLGFSVAYPPDLVATEPPEGPGGERDVEFKSASSPRGFTVAVLTPGTGTDYGPVDQFADGFCPREKGEGLLGGYPAITCKAYTEIKDVWASIIVSQHNGLFYVISAAYWPDETELEAMFQSFRFVN